MIQDSLFQFLQQDDGGDVAVTGLQSAKSTIRLEQIAALRARGVGDHVDLPQLVVCGDQSAGKSSVLEGLTGLPFPRQDGVCTKFPTEIILQHTTGEHDIHAAILPSSTSTDNCRDALQNYKRRLADFTALPQVISEVGSLMGVRGFGDIIDGPAFSESVLRIEVSGPVGLHLTVVDLPGLISVPNEEQTDEDVKTVHRLVENYISNPRTIILAVVQAGNDIANQTIIRKSREVDKAGQRTVGITTKPDLINEGSVKRIALLAKNKDTTKLKLGYFLIKNPTPTELAEGISQERRHSNEIEYFQSKAWKETALSKDRVGVLALRAYLQTLLDRHIEQELPKVRGEINSLLENVDQELALLGEARISTGELRSFLSRLATRFNNLVTSALNGSYHEADSIFFGKPDAGGQSMRLRALVHQLNTNFSDHMREEGQKRKVVHRASPDEDPDLAFLDDEFDLPPRKEHNSSNGQIRLTESEMKKWVREVSVAAGL